MGGDGGSIPGRRDLVDWRAGKKETLEAEASVVAESKWTECALSQQPLVDPVVVDELGKLYNKTAIIEYLLAKHRVPLLSHIRGLKDLAVARLLWEESQQQQQERRHRHFVCPVTGIAANGKHRFLVMRGCGCVVSEKAYKEVPSHSCLVCNAPLDRSVPVADWVLTLFPEQEEEDGMRQRMQERRQAAKEAKRAKKQQERQQQEHEQEHEQQEADGKEHEEDEERKERKREKKKRLRNEGKRRGHKQQEKQQGQQSLQALEGDVVSKVVKQSEEGLGRYRDNAMYRSLFLSKEAEEKSLKERYSSGRGFISTKPDSYLSQL